MHVETFLGRAGLMKFLTAPQAYLKPVFDLSLNGL